MEKCIIIFINHNISNINTNIKKNIEKLIKGCQILGIPIIWLEQYPKGLGKTIPELSKLLINQSPIEKRFFNALEEEAVENEISKLKKAIGWFVA